MDTTSEDKFAWKKIEREFLILDDLQLHNKKLFQRWAGIVSRPNLRFYAGTTKNHCGL